MARPLFSFLAITPVVTHGPDKLVAGTRVTPFPAPTSAKMVPRLGGRLQSLPEGGAQARQIIVSTGQPEPQPTIIVLKTAYQDALFPEPLEQIFGPIGFDQTEQVRSTDKTQAGRG